MDPNKLVIRTYQPSDHDIVKLLTIEGFAGVCLDFLIETRWPGESALSWGERKWLGTERDVLGHPDWCFVAELNHAVVGYITTTMSDSTRQGHINDMVVDSASRGKGIGRGLVQHALSIFRQHHMTIARIEALSGNEVGQGHFIRRHGE